MKMPDGGFRPAYNVQLVRLSRSSQVIVGVEVINRGTDQGEALAVEDQVASPPEADHPEADLTDGGFVDLQDIATLERRGVRVYAPPKEREGGPGGELEAWYLARGTGVAGKNGNP